jgi:ferredoxin-NADP reductase
MPRRQRRFAARDRRVDRMIARRRRGGGRLIERRNPRRGRRRCLLLLVAREREERAARDDGAGHSTEARHAGTLASVSGNVHEGELVRAVMRADGVVEYVVRTDEPLRFRPGQFVSVRVGMDGDDNPILRSYSIASPPGRAEISLILKLIKGGPGSDFFAALEPGGRVRFTGPMGFFCLDLLHAGDVVFGVTGVGITPVLPMITELAERPERGRIILYWGNRHAEDLFWLDELKALQQTCARLSIEIFLTGEAPSWSGRRGRITQAVVDELPSFDKPVFYLVGNGAMIKELKAALQERGVDRKRQIRNEAFFG